MRTLFFQRRPRCPSVHAFVRQGTLSGPHKGDRSAPPLEVLGYFFMPLLYASGLLDLDVFMAYIALTFIFGVFISVGALVLEELELRRYPNASYLPALMLAAIAENFGYRQINTIWRVQGWWQYMRGRMEWEKPARKGFG